MEARGNNLDSHINFLDILWQNVRSNEDQRNKFLNFYIIISGAYFVLVEGLSTNISGHNNLPVPIIVAILVATIGLLFISIFLRCRCVIVRDLIAIKCIVETIANSMDSPDSEAYKNISNFYKKRKINPVFRSFDNTTLIVFTVIMISTSILYASVMFSINSLALAISTVGLSLLVHVLGILFFNKVHNAIFNTG